MTSSQQAASLDILEDLAATRRVIQKPCKLGIMRREHPDLAEQYDRALDARAAIEAEGKNPTKYGLTDDAIARWLRGHGADINGQSIQRHRTGRCERCQTSSTT